MSPSAALNVLLICEPEREEPMGDFAAFGSMERCAYFTSHGSRCQRLRRADNRIAELQ